MLSNFRMHALTKTDSVPLHDRNILLVIAHPDDEVMFFGPTLVGITNDTYNNHVRVLCLSNGIPSRGRVDGRECAGDWVSEGTGVDGQCWVFWNHGCGDLESSVACPRKDC
jgi:hypothetical protein